MVREGIDVSQYQGQIDWELVKNHIDFAILRVWLWSRYSWSRRSS